MKLYRAKVPAIAREILETLANDGDIELPFEKREEAEKDLVAIMEEFLRRDNDFRERIRDHMAARNMPYDQYGSVRKTLAEQTGQPLGEDIERFLVRQFIENMMISPHVDEVYGEDKDLYKKVMGILRTHDVDEREIREEAISRIKNVKEGTVDYELALQHAMRDVKKRRGLLGDRDRDRDRDQK